MSDSEIVRSYKEARRKGEQVKILAQLNACSTDDILKILKINNVEGANKRIFNTVPTVSKTPVGAVKMSKVPPKIEPPYKEEKISKYAENKEVTKIEEIKKMKLPKLVLGVLDQRTREMQKEIDMLTDQITRYQEQRSKLEEEFTELVAFLEGAEIDE
jgi:flagellar capping protein FliD